MGMAEEMQGMEAWLITTVKAILYFQWRISGSSHVGLRSHLSLTKDQSHESGSVAFLEQSQFSEKCFLRSAHRSCGPEWAEAESHAAS